MIVPAAVALLLAAAGLLLVRTAAPFARLLAWGVGLGFAAAAFLLPGAAWREVAVVPPAVVLRGDAAAVRTAVLAAALAADARADGLRVVWREPVPGLPQGAFGAAIEVPPALPLQPEDLRVEALGVAAAGRPLALQVPPLALAAPLPAELRVSRGGQVVHREDLELGRSPRSLAFTPQDAGPHTIELIVAAGPHRVIGRGAFDVVAPKPVLVLEPSGLFAAALRAQGVMVVEATALPADPGAHAAVVVGMPLPAAAQAALATAVRDGLGAFVLAPGFGGVGEPVRGLLPLRPAPQQPDAEGQGASRAPRGDAPPPPAEPPPAAPPPTPPPPEGPPRGDTSGASKPSAEPIEVDKRAIAMVLVVDRSGSMGAPLGDGRTKMSYAKSSALRTAQALGEGDTVGVVTFGNKDQGRIVLPMTDAADDAKVRGGIAQLAHANEATFLLGGLRRAYEMMRTVDAAVKHVVVITDGEFVRTEELALRALANRGREQDKITLSVISIVDGQIGPTFVAAAEGLAHDGGGQFFEVRDPGKVPAFVSAEVTRSLTRVGRKPREGRGAGDGPPLAKDEPPPPPPPTPEPAAEPPPAKPASPVRLPVRAVAESPLLAPPPPLAWPTLGRAVAGTAPLDARVLLVAGDEGWPLLAYGNRGLGRVGAFAADLCGEAGAEFRAEAAFPARVAQWVQSVLPAQPAAAPAALLTSFVVEPVAPTPRDVAALLAFGGAGPTPPAVLPAPRPRLLRDVVPATPDAAPWLVLGLVVLAFAERRLASRALRAAAR